MARSGGPYGCEHIPFLDMRIRELERTQAQVAKEILGVPMSTANICAQTELGFKPIRQVLYEHQLGFFKRLLSMPASRWAHLALMDHINGGWQSVYLAYITKIRCETNSVKVFSDKHAITLQLSPYFLKETNSSLETLTLPAVSPVKRYQKLRYVTENPSSTVLAKFRLANADLGNRAPLPGHRRFSSCPLCRGPNCDEVHLVCQCPSLASERRRFGIGRFFGLCGLQGLGIQVSYRYYLEGRDPVGEPISLQDYLDRGKALEQIRKAWWGKLGC